MSLRAASSPRREFAIRSEVDYVRTLLAVARQSERADAATPLRQRLTAAEVELTAALDDGGAMDEIASRLGLSTPQLGFLWSAAIFAADPRLAVHAEALAGSAARRGLSVALHAAIHELDNEIARDLAVELCTGSPLIELGLLTASEEGWAPAVRPYVVPPRVLAYLRGHLWEDPELRWLAPGSDDLLLDDAQRRALELLERALGGAPAGVVVVVEGTAGAGRARAIARAAGRPIIELDGTRLDRARVGTGLATLRREALLVDAVPVISDVDRLLRDEAATEAFGRSLDRLPGFLVATSSVPGVDLGTRRAVVRVTWPVPGPAIRRQLWIRAAGGTPSGDLELLATRYPIGAGTIGRAVESARLTAPPGSVLDAGDLATGLRHNIAERLGGLARRVEVTQRWDELVVGDETRDQLTALIARVRFAPQVMERWGYRGKLARGAGVPALFSGPPGTGKSMCAGLIAAELDLELYQVDLSQVVSKWVGETEKQLARVFDAAEEGHALLLFDEADALFGQRTGDVKGAVDRYANLEVNFLLQRVEAFGGLVILTTNMDTAIDRALKRRLAAHIVFDAPDEEEQLELWRRLTATSRAPLAPDLRLDELPRAFPNMTGANIRNAALAAAFLAASDGAAHITAEHLQRAARSEYRAMGHVLAERARIMHRSQG